jgi:hypothetical protein
MTQPRETVPPYDYLQTPLLDVAPSHRGPGRRGGRGMQNARRWGRILPRLVLVITGLFSFFTLACVYIYVCVCVCECICICVCMCVFFLFQRKGERGGGRGCLLCPLPLQQVHLVSHHHDREVIVVVCRRENVLVCPSYNIGVNTYIVCSQMIMQEEDNCIPATRPRSSSLLRSQSQEKTE